MFTTNKQLQRYERRMKIRNFKEILQAIVQMVFIVTVFIFLCDLAYRLSFII